MGIMIGKFYSCFYLIFLIEKKKDNEVSQNGLVLIEALIR